LLFVMVVMLVVVVVVAAGQVGLLFLFSFLFCAFLFFRPR